jgi:hypothetical protein
MKMKLKLSEILAAKETSLRTVEKAAGRDDTLSAMLTGSIWQYCDGIVDVVTPFAKELGVDPHDMECKRVSRAYEKAAKGEDADAVQIITTRDMDRDREIVIPEGINSEHFDMAPQVLLGHNHGELPVALGPIKSRSKSDIKAAVTFGPTQRAQEAKELVQGGFLRTASIGFVTLQYAGRDSDMFNQLVRSFSRVPGFSEHRDELRGFIPKSLLLEWSYVSVPSNQNALTEAVKKGELELCEEWMNDLKLDVKQPEKSAPVEIKGDLDKDETEEKEEAKAIDVEVIPQVEVVRDAPEKAIEVEVLDTSSLSALPADIKNLIDVKHRGAV